MTPTTVILDLDGTLVDSVYVHTLAWKAAFRDVAVEVSGHRLHRLIGMGSDRLVAAAAGQAVEDALGDRVRDLHKSHLDETFGQITPADGAVELLTALRDHHLEVVLASSGDSDDTDRLLDLLGEGRGVLDAVITGSEAEHSKPDGELLERALEAVDADTAIVVGDAVWDVRAATDAGVRCIGVLTGGFSEAELREAGAVDVVDSARTLAERLDERGVLL
jgi:phosphoglycolate phosphatase